MVALCDLAISWSNSLLHSARPLHNQKWNAIQKIQLGFAGLSVCLCVCVCVFGGAARYGLRRSGASAVIHVIKILQDQLKICMEMKVWGRTDVIISMNSFIEFRFYCNQMFSYFWAKVPEHCKQDESGSYLSIFAWMVGQ